MALTLWWKGRGVGWGLKSGLQRKEQIRCVCVYIFIVRIDCVIVEARIFQDVQPANWRSGESMVHGLVQSCKAQDPRRTSISV